MNEAKCLNPWDPQSKRQYAIDGVYCALNAGHGGGGHGHEICYGISRSCMTGGNGSNGGMPLEEGIQPTMQANGVGAVCYRSKHEGNIMCRERTASSDINDGNNEHAGLHARSADNSERGGV